MPFRRHWTVSTRLKTKNSLLLIAALIGLACNATAQRTPLYLAPPYQLYDGLDAIAKSETKVRDVIAVNRTPLFDNAPFLHLRSGDQLVRAKIDADGQAMRFSGAQGSETYYYFVRSKGKYYRISTYEQGGKLLLGTPERSLLFDWAFTIENCRALRRLLSPVWAESLSATQYKAIVQAVQKEYPEINVSPYSELREDHLVSIPSYDFAEFEGWAYDVHLNCIYRYTTRIGPKVFSIQGEPLVQGPPHVDRLEFEQEEIADSLTLDVDFETAKRKRAEYGRMIKFMEMIEEAIHPEAASPPP